MYDTIKFVDSAEMINSKFPSKSVTVPWSESSIKIVAPGNGKSDWSVTVPLIVFEKTKIEVTSSIGWLII